MNALETYHAICDGWDDGIYSNHELVMRVLCIGFLSSEALETRRTPCELVREYLASIA